MTIEQIIEQIDELSNDTLVATNSGTFSAEECCRATGSGDPVHGEWRTYERLDGTRYTTGANPETAPGYVRRFSPTSAVARRAKIAGLQSAMAASQTVAQQHASQRANLARGWDGCRFVGVAEGQRLLAAMGG